MSLWHTHNYELVATTYAPPALEASRIERFSGDASRINKLVFGVTTFVWKCSDRGCGSVLVQTALGKVQP